ncbi:MAG: carboxypeptidase regulatory-like domain-containing protein [Flavobacteriales bacterium]|nr:carboxypeptidase regulatory-like domain-containing protein [Flavobacteriales bacterium]MEB2340546.1 hypothetical protein [Flavobacteriia bacterium]
MNLTTAHSLWLAPLCVLLGIGAAWLLYRGTREKNGWGPALQWSMGVLRAVVIALLAFFLLEPMVRLLVREVRKPVVVLAHDGSSSLLATGDPSAFREGYAKALEALASQLGDRYEVRSFTYGSEVEDGLHFAQRDEQTDIDQLFRTVYDRFAGPDLGAVVIDGDGIYNRGRDPRLAAERLGVPVFAIMLGDTTVRPDLVLRGVDHNRITYLGNQFPLLVKWKADHLAGKNTRLSVLHNGKEVAAKDLAIPGDPMMAEVPLLIQADVAGLQRYTIALRAVQGEVTTANNQQDIYVDVLDDRRKVLILARAPHPDVAAIRQAMASVEGYTVESALASNFTGPVAAYDLVILHQLPAPDAALQTVFQQIGKKEIPTWTIVGQQSDLRQVGELGDGVSIEHARGGFTDAQAAFLPDFTLFTLDPEDIRSYERFPPLQVPFAQYNLSRSATPLFSQRIGSVRTAYPLFAFQAQAARRTAITCGEGLWRWRLADMQQNNTTTHFDRLVQKTVQFLALKQDKSRFRVKVEREFAQNEKVAFDAELYNASYEPVNTPEASITLRNEDGKELAYTFSRADGGYHLDAGVLPAGRYTWQAAVRLDDQRLTAQGEFLVKPLVAERMNTVADHGLWENMAARTGGLAVGPDKLEAITGSLKDRPELAARSYSHSSFTDLIGVRWLFFPLLLLLTAEWALRRRSGTY